MDKFWTDIMNCLIGCVLYHGRLPEENSWCEQYKYEVENMVDDIKNFHKSVISASLEVRNEDMAKFLIYTEYIHIGNEHFIKECKVFEPLLIEIASKVNDELN